MNIARALTGGYGGGEQMTKDANPQGYMVKPRTFKEQIQDQIASHHASIERLQNVLDSMSPDVEKFVEALQKANL